MKILAAVLARLGSLDDQRICFCPPVAPNRGDLPANALASVTARDPEFSIAQQGGDVQVRSRSAYWRKLITQIPIDRGKPSGQTDLRFTLAIQFDQAVIEILLLVGFHRCMGKEFIGGVERVIDLKI